MIDTVWNSFKTAVTNWTASPSDESIQYNIPKILRDSGFDLTSRRIVQEIHSLVNLCDIYTEDWKTGNHYFTEHGDKDWANEKEVVKNIFYHFCGGKTLFEQLPPVEFESLEEVANFVDDRPILRLRVSKKDIGVKIGREILYFGSEGNLMVKLFNAEPKVLIKLFDPPRFHVDINTYITLHHRIFGRKDD